MLNSLFIGALAWFTAVPSPLSTAPMYTLDELIEEAVLHQPVLEAYRHRRQVALAQRRQVASVNYPVLNIAAQGLAATNVASSADFYSVDDVPRLAGIATSTGMPTSVHPSYELRVNSFIAVSGHYRLLDFGQSTHRVAAAQAAVTTATATERQALQDTIFKVSVSYYSLIAAFESYQIALDAQQRVKKQAAMVKASVTAGLRPTIDLARSDAEVAAANLNVLRADAVVTIQKASLRTAVGWERREFNVSSKDEPSSEEELNLAPLMTKALRDREDYAAIQADMLGAHHQLKAAQALHFPRVMATANASARGVNESPTAALNWGVGLLLDLPVFRGFEVSGEVDAARARISEAQAQRRALTNQISQQLEEAVAKYLSARESINVAHSQVLGAKATLDQAEARYKDGLGNIIELADAQTQYDVAQGAVVQARLLKQTSDVRIRYTTGSLILEPQRK